MLFYHKPRHLNKLLNSHAHPAIISVNNAPDKIKFQSKFIIPVRLKTIKVNNATNKTDLRVLCFFI